MLGPFLGVGDMMMNKSKSDPLPHRTFYLMIKKDVNEISQKETYKMLIKKKDIALKDYIGGNGS